MKTDTGYSTHAPRARRYLVVVPSKPDLIDGSANAYMITQATDNAGDALATRDAPGMVQLGAQIYELADDTFSRFAPRVVRAAPVKCAHESTHTNRRSDGIEVERCIRCEQVRSINRVRIEGGTFSGDQRRIAKLSARDVADLLEAYREE